MARFSVLSARLAVPALVMVPGVLLFFCAAAFAQGAGFETAPGSQPASQIVTSNGQPVISVGPAAPASGVASQPSYGAFGDAAPAGMYVAPLGYGANNGSGVGAAPSYAPPVYSAPVNTTQAASPGYSIQAQPTSGPYAAAPQPSPYAAPQPYMPLPYAYGAPMPDYTPQAQPYAPGYALQPYAAQAQPYAPQPQPFAQQPMYAQQPAPQPYAAQTAPYAVAPQARTQPAQAPQQMPAGAPARVPYGAGATGYGAVLPRNVANVANMPQAEGGYTLGPGDKVKITIFNEPELSGEYQLDGNGNIRFPLIGMVRAAGNTAGSLEGWIRAALQPNYVRNPRINVEITGYRPIYVTGAVVKPGQYTYVNDMTLLNAVALAGGFTNQAKESTVYVRHEGEAEEQAVPSHTPLLIRPGDTVRVTTTLFWDAMNFFGPLSSPVAIAAAAGG